MKRNRRYLVRTVNETNEDGTPKNGSVIGIRELLCVEVTSNLFKFKDLVTFRIVHNGLFGGTTIVEPGAEWWIESDEFYNKFVTLDEIY